MPDAITLLSLDHRKVETLFEQFEATQDHQLALQICQELSGHAELEEDIVYPLLKKIDPNLEQEAEQEHDEAKKLISQIEAMDRGDARLAETVLELKEAVSHHVQEEESQAFPKLKEEVGEDLEELGAVMTVRKQELRRRDESS